MAGECIFSLWFISVSKKDDQCNFVSQTGQQEIFKTNRDILNIRTYKDFLVGLLVNT